MKELHKIDVISLNVGNVYFSKDSNNDIIIIMITCNHFEAWITTKYFFMLLNVYIWVIVLVLHKPSDL